MIQSPPPPSENTTDLHVQKRDKQSVSAWFQARSQAQRLVLGYGGGGGKGGRERNPMLGWEPLKVPCPHLDLSFTKHLTPL